ncbi:hypothetical protein Rleg10DRAFT_3122 [Rhizobium leguminosarum bv. trifolii WSM2012]|nr:hypothetical protein Rleg10DRAFT_3122 [Rhizobium leguminosarum bv. trifolii WSM2012]
MVCEGGFGKQVGDDGAISDIAALFVTGALQPLQDLDFAARCLDAGRDDSEGGRRRIEQGAGRAENLAAIDLRERLSGQPGDALVVLPGIGRKARIHRSCPRPGEKPGGGKLYRHVLERRQALDGRAGTVAPTAKGVEKIGDPHVRLRTVWRKNSPMPDMD